MFRIHAFQKESSFRLAVVDAQGFTYNQHLQRGRFGEAVLPFRYPHAVCLELYPKRWLCCLLNLRPGLFR